MKNVRLPVFGVIIAAFVVCGCGRVKAQMPDAGSLPNEDITVYVTASGGRYHRDGCSSLRSSRILVSLSDAAAGYTACSICKPPVPATVKARNPAEFYRVNVEEPVSFARVEITRLLPVSVIDHVDGDTVRVRIDNPPDGLKVVETIRLIGVDTPETVHPRRTVEAFGVEASNFTKSRLLGTTAYLAFDWDLRDKYNRLLAYIYTGGGLCHNAEIIRAGYGHAYTRFSFYFMEEFRAIEREAREAKRGLWG
ncbi:MAG: thermonuclease family protein [Treponema sp.]|jgi:micrococcal nuclease|nr:thermonuclease family protein [Treponema sp.]